MSQEGFSDYLNQIRTNYQEGDYTEYTNRTPLENLITQLDDSFKLTHEAQREAELGAPDFKAKRKGAIIGYIETKDLDKDLSDILGTEQIERYQNSIENVVLTNYSRFILLRNSEKVLDVRLFEQDDLDLDSAPLDERKVEELENLISEFYSYEHETISSPKKLALEMSKKAQLLKELSEDQLENDQRKGSSSTVSEFQSALEGLLDDVDNEFTADAFAETVTYSLFLARMSSEEKIDYNTAYEQIPGSISIIRKLFFNIAADEINDNISWLVEEITELLNVTDIDSIKNEMDFRRKTDKDPFSHFYENFLKEYNETRRQNRGEYYTPRPVVSFISNMVNRSLKENFDKRLGIAENDVKVLDPAVGTGTFLWITYLVAIKELRQNGLGGVIHDKIENHFLQDFYGIELMFTPYIISHLKLAMVLNDWDYQLEDDDRIQVYLSNSLEPEEETEGAGAFLQELDAESQKANEIKKEEDIIAILGNPPYKGASENQGEWIDSLLKNGYERADGSKDDGYYKVQGQPLDEKNPKYLQDDYVKFIRFSQWKIDQNNKGVVGLITNHSFLDNPTFRGMRESLIESFHRIYIVNLHGNQRRKEQSPDGSKDENVFNIKQGVCITIFVRNPDKFDETKILYADKWGSQEKKFGWLDRVHPDSDSKDFIEWEPLQPEEPKYFLIPRNRSLHNEYKKFWKLTEIFPENTGGVVTAKDNIAIWRNQDKFRNFLESLPELDPDEAREKFDRISRYGDKKIEETQNDLAGEEVKEERIERILYRPFDYRFTYYTGNSNGIHERPRELMEHMREDNLALISARSNKTNTMDHFFCSDSITEAKAAESSTQSYAFPLYIYDKGTQTKLDNSEQKEKNVNINSDLLEELEGKYEVEISPRKIFNYIYGVIHSSEYRDTYSEFMKTDFPRIPFPKSKTAFDNFARLGEKLVKLHLLEVDTHSDVKYPEGGDNKVEKVDYEDQNIYINDSQYFEGINEDVWEFTVGGYQVLKYWLKKRKGTEISSGEIQDFIQIIGAIEKTLSIIEKVDEEYVEAEF